MKNEINISLQEKTPLSIVMSDIDDFKKVNDTKGHVYVDRVLINIAAIMQKSVREIDLVGKYGGEEFMFSKTYLKEAALISECITQEDYFLAGRSMPWIPIALSVAATMISANSFIGAPGWAYGSGIAPFMVNITVPFAIFLAMYVTVPVMYQ